MKNYYLYFNKLKSIASNKYGYSISSIRPNHTSRVNHTRKIIEIRKGNNIEVLYEFCHELGHCAIHIRVKHKFINELLAWVVGFIICVQLKIPKRKYWHHAIYCLRSYFK
jgi:hypothetical protein